MNEDKSSFPGYSIKKQEKSSFQFKQSRYNWHTKQDPARPQLKNLEQVAEEFYRKQKQDYQQNYQKFMRRVYKFQNREKSSKKERVRLNRNNSYEDLNFNQKVEDDRLSSKSEKELLNPTIFEEFDVPQNNQSYLLQEEEKNENTIEISYQDYVLPEEQVESEYTIETKMRCLQVQNSVIKMEIQPTQKDVPSGQPLDNISLSIVTFYIMDQLRIFLSQGDGRCIFTNFITVMFFYISILHLVEVYKKETIKGKRENVVKISNSSLDFRSVSQDETMVKSADLNFSKINQSINIDETSSVLQSMSFIRNDTEPKDIKSQIVKKHFLSSSLLCRLSTAQKSPTKRLQSDTTFSKYVGNKFIRNKLLGVGKKNQNIKLELIGKHNQFFESLPFYTRLKMQGCDSSAQSAFKASLSFSISQQDLSLSNITISRLDYQLLNLKIYEPFFISNSTIIAYQIQSDINDLKMEKLSLMKILEENWAQGNQKLYFKVSMAEEWEENNTDTGKQGRGSQNTLSPMDEIKEGYNDINPSPLRQINTHELEDSNTQQISVSYSDDVLVEGTIGGRNSDSQSEFSENYSNNGDTNQELIEDQTLYYEFELKQYGDSKELIFLTIKDITAIIKGLQKIQDHVYLTAIENNFSHELMTPLNPIISSSSMLKRGLITGFKGISEDNSQEVIEGQCAMALSTIGQNRDACNLIRNVISIEQSAKSMWYFNTNQIIRQKLLKNQFQIEQAENRSMLETIMKVLWPFEYFIFQRRINIYLINMLYKNYSIIMDTQVYKLILFNLLQNGVKYNKTFDGDVVIVLDCKPSKYSNDHYILETQVIDTGSGIDQQRQKLLFVPLKEIRDSIGGHSSKNENIGLGLSCCKIMCKKMGGDIMLKKSQKGMTVFTFKFPVRITGQNQGMREKELLMSGQTFSSKQKVRVKQCQMLVGQERPFPGNITEYMRTSKYYGVIQKSNFLPQSKGLIDIVNHKLGFRHIDQFEKLYPFKICHRSMSPYQNKSSSQSLFPKGLFNIDKSIISLKEEQKVSIDSCSKKVSKSEINNQGRSRFNLNSQKLDKVSNRQSSFIIQKPIVKLKNDLIEDLQKVNLNFQIMDRDKKLKIASQILVNPKISKAIQIGQIIEEEQPEQDEIVHDLFVNKEEHERARKRRRLLQGIIHSSVSSDSESEGSIYQQKSDFPSDEKAPEEEEKKMPEGSLVSNQEKLAIISEGDNEGSIYGSRQLACNCKPRILIVDDTEYNIYVVRLLLEEFHDLEPDQAQNGQIALEMFKALMKQCPCPNSLYKLIIMDIQMPVMDGYQCSEKILQIVKKFNLEVSIVALTSFTSDKVIQKCKEIGVKEVIHKPLKKEKLDEMVKKYYNNKQE